MIKFNDDFLGKANPICSDDINYVCGICNNTFNRVEKYPDFTIPPYIQLVFAGSVVSRPLCPHCFNEWKNKLKIEDRDFMGGEKRG